jgi:prolyl-tRNA synthetase
MPAILEGEQAELLRQATELRDRLTRPVTTIDTAREQGREGAARLPWGGLGPAGEQSLLDDGISVRCLVHPDGEPVRDPDAAGVDAIVARAY